MRVLFLAALAVVSICASSTAFGQANWDNRDTNLVVDGTSNGRTFRSTMMCEGEGDGWTTWGCNDGDPCTRDIKRGGNPGFNASCCRWTNICNAQGELLPEAEINEIMAQSEQKDRDLQSVFEANTTITYWGYYAANNRSPQVGRTVAALAKLDVCLGETDVATAISMGATWCVNTACPGAYNDHCTSSSGGESVCADRCDCAINGVGSSTCNSR